MTAKDKKPGKFYQLFKIHKKFKEPNLPPGKPIISGCGSITENISLYVNHHAKDLVPEIPSYLQDTPHFLRELETLKNTVIPQNSFPISVDVVGLYTNIPHNEGIESLKRALNTRKTKEVSTDFLVKLLSFVLKHNIFEFNGKYYQQQIGTAMGTRVAPTMANIFMASIDNLIQSTSVTENLNYIHFYKRFIDDIFIIWTGSEEDLKLFMSKINDVHKSIKFTCDYDLSKRSTTFLDTTISLIDNELNSDLYKKTNR
jgi:hypothetical protein